MLIAHTPQQEPIIGDQEYVDPNSMQYHNAVMEDKINKHEKKKTKDIKRSGLKANLFGSSFEGVEEYSGKYSPRKLFNSSSKKGKS